MAKPGFWSRLFRLEEAPQEYQALPPPPNDDMMPKKVTIYTEPVGSSGVEVYSGYFAEEYLQELQGAQAADLYDKMRRSDPKLKMISTAVKNPIKGATWDVEAVDETPESEKQAALIKHIIFKGMDKPWSETVHEILSCIDFGFSLFEKTHKQVLDHPEFGAYTGLKKLGYRSQRTIEQWNMDENGVLLSVSQYAYGDLQRTVDIPAEALVNFALDKEGDLYEGVSMFRACYGAWKRKNQYLKMMAIGSEKYAVPTPAIKIPEGKDNSAQLANLRAVMQKYMSHQQAYITLPTGWEIEFAQTNFDPQKLAEAAKFENVEMVHAFLANFLELGQSGSGSYSLSFDLSDFFLGSVEHIAQQICEVFNHYIIPELVELNFGPQASYPKLTVSGITDKAGKELAEVAKILVDGRIIVPDDELEENMRERFDFPKKSLLGQRGAPANPLDPNAPPQDPNDPNTPPKGVEDEPKKEVDASSKKSEEPIDEKKLAEPKVQMREGKEELKALMQTHLKKISQGLIEQVMAKYRSLPDSQTADAIKNNSPVGVRDYQEALKQFFTDEADAALAQARKDVPAKKNIRLAEFEDLPSKVRKRLLAQSQLLVTSQLASLEKAVYFQFLSSMVLDSEAQVEMDLHEAADKAIDSSSIDAAAGNSEAQIVNESRNAFYFDDEVLEEIESFTFVNGDPVSEICQALAGTTFSKDDPDFDAFQPPLHHNCKSHYVPNLKGGTKRDITEKDEKWRVSVAKAKDSITLAETGTLPMQKICISKKAASTLQDAQRIAQEFQAQIQVFEVTEYAYEFWQKDPSLFVEGSLKTFEPMEGVTIWYGTDRPILAKETKRKKKASTKS